MNSSNHPEPASPPAGPDPAAGPPPAPGLPDVVVLGSGPAGLAAAWELARSGRRAVVFERDAQVGGLAKTVVRDGYRFDIGGHRFFTKVPEVLALWQEMLGDRMLRRPRLSRIYYRQRFFYYPLRPWNTFFQLGPMETAAILGSYAAARLAPPPAQDSFEDWVSSRFGRRLYETFFRSYTEKVWGIPCSEIDAEWAGQRIRGLSLGRAVAAAFGLGGARPKSLIDEFLYPDTGPGLLYEVMQQRLDAAASPVRVGTEVVAIEHDGARVHAVRTRPGGGGAEVRTPASHVISSVPLPLLVRAMDPAPPPAVVAAARALSFRALVTVNLVLGVRELFPDNWIYVHDPGVKVGRIQNYKNWSPKMVPDPATTSLGLEYFCTVGDDFWGLSDDEMLALARRELEQIGLGRQSDVRSGFVVRVPRAYPVYRRGYREHLEVLRAYLRPFANLHAVGRHGMFRYNNQDHSTLTGMLAARNILAGSPVHDLWSVNVDDGYLEEGAEGKEAAGG